MPIFEEARLEDRLRLGLVFDGGQLFNHLTVAENIALPLRYHQNLSQDEAAAAVRRTAGRHGTHALGGQHAGHAWAQLAEARRSGARAGAPAGGAAGGQSARRAWTCGTRIGGWASSTNCPKATA